ncbi:hypothetical protein COLO4_10245 [Corchorus olitorius]|uniref:Reverse transcriptase RNase H-like domain-containing protein n=1 Tax=Corchorus olitorius TaxID=93759 RepID=A0A1R3K9E9_9ROSI|nr:hypothetical protein COLO4_10245 [Corchorus olitorius]
MEKHCLSLVLATQKLRHYLLAHKVTVVTKSDPIRYILSRPILAGRAVKWLLVLGQFDLSVAQPKAIKSQALSDLLAYFPTQADEVVTLDSMPGDVDGEGALYYRGPNGILARCISPEEAKERLRASHKQWCGMEGPPLYRRMQRAGYYWPTMSSDCANAQYACLRCSEPPDVNDCHFVGSVGDWRRPYIEYLQNGAQPANHQDARNLKRKRRISRAYDKMLRRRSFEPGDQVLRAAEHVMRGAPPPHKFSEKWEGPYIVHEVHDSGYCTLLNPRNNNALTTPINFHYIKKYHV